MSDAPVKRLVLFDIDGTILLTSGAGRRAMVGAVAAEIGVASGLDRIRFDGKTDPQIVTELLAASGDPEPPAPNASRRSAADMSSFWLTSWPNPLLARRSCPAFTLCSIDWRERMA